MTRQSVIPKKDELDLDKSDLRNKLEELEGKTRYLESRAQNNDYISKKAAENEDLMRLKYADLAKRHDDVLAKYMGIQEENKILRKLQNTPSNEVHSQVLITSLSGKMIKILAKSEKNASDKATTLN